MCKIANYPKKISDSWLFVVRTEKVRLFFIFRAYIQSNISIKKTIDKLEILGVYLQSKEHLFFFIKSSSIFKQLFSCF